MLSIINEKFIRFEDGKPTVFAELCVDTAEELPTAESLSDRTLAQGSVAWDISNGEFYALKSTGEWVNQSGGD